MGTSCISRWIACFSKSKRMDFSQYRKLKTISGIIFVATFISVCYLDFWIKYQNGHGRQTKLVGHFNQRLEDISAIYEREMKNSAVNLHSALQALVQDGYHPVAISRTSHIASSKEEANQKNDPANRQIDGNNTRSLSGAVVPKIVHYVFIGSDLGFTFVNYLSFLSVERFLKPYQIFIHGDIVPSGKWWTKTQKEVKNIYHVKRPCMDTAPNGQPLKYSSHASDYIRAEILVHYGGIYLDGDVLVLKSFDPLLKYPTVLGRETYYGVCNGIMMASKGAPFMRFMLEQYRSYRGYAEDWATLSVENTHRLVNLYPHLVHIEETSLNRPNWGEMVQIYHMNYDWSENYAMHLYVRIWPEVMRPSGFGDVLTVDSAFGEMARAIIYGTNRSSHSVSLSSTRPILIGLLFQL